MSKKTVVIGASDNPERTSFQAVQRLVKNGHEVIAVGVREGMIGNTPVTQEKNFIADVDTVTLYVGPKNQPGWYDYILSLKPARIIFNPGTENPEFEKMANDKGIETPEACTLVMLSIGNY